jgi:hypothetical protein
MRTAFALIVASLVAGCATYEETLTNTQGQTMTCKASGKNGIITGHYLRESFEQCIDQAKQAGYTEGSPANPPTSSAKN